MSSACPTENELLGYHLGRLPDGEVAAIASHLDLCAACEAAVARLEGQGDSVLAGLRGQPPVPAETPPFLGAARRETPAPPGYDILGVLGEGGMGVVFRARHTRLDRLVALKRVRSGSDAERSRLRSEAMAVARLQHPGIVQLFEVFDHDGEQYLTLELVEGETLVQRLRAGPLPVAEAAGLVASLADAMQHAHERGVIHRDLKPANVLLGREPGDSPKVTDFGIAKRSGGETLDGWVAGTPAYMAPEQSEGRAKVGPSADVYSLGVILYEVLTGRPPLLGASPAETLLLTRTREPSPPRGLRPAVPRDLDTVCLKCLHKDPARRYATTADLAADLRRFLDGRPVLARPTPAWERAAKWTRRRPAVAGLLTAVVVITTVAFFLVTDWAREAEKQKGVAVRRLRETEFALYISQVSRASRDWRDRDPGGARRLLDSCPPHLRGWEWYHLYRLTEGSSVTVDLGERPGMAVAARGGRVATVDADGNLRFHDLLGRPLGPAVTAPDPVSLAFSADGKSLAVGGRTGGVQLRDGVTGAERFARQGHRRDVWGVAFAPDGKWLASASQDGTIKFWDVATGEELPANVAVGLIGLWDLSVSRDGKRVAAASFDGFGVWEVATGKRVLWVAAPPLKFRFAAFSPGGDTIATSAGVPGGVAKGFETRIYDATDGRLIVSRPEATDRPSADALAWDTQGRTLAVGVGPDIVVRDGASLELVDTLRGHSTMVKGLAWAGSGQLASVAFEGTLKVWDRSAVGRLAGGTRMAFAPDGLFASAEGGGRVRLRAAAGDAELAVWDAPGGVTAMALSAGGRLAVTAPDGTGRVRDLVAGRDLFAFRGDPSSTRGLAFSLDGKLLAAAERGGRVTVRDATTGDVRYAFALPPGPVRALAFGPGAVLAAGCENGEVHVRDGAGGAVRASRVGDTVNDVAFAPDGRLAASDDKRVVLWDAAGEEIWRIDSPGRPLVLSFSADGGRIAGACLNGAAVWETATGQETFRVNGPEESCVAVAFAPDGVRLAVGSGDTTEMRHAPRGEP